MHLLQANVEPNYLALLVIVAFVLGTYLLPTIIASLRKHHQIASIAVVNLFLGWTLLGWVAALAWAVSTTRPMPA